MPTYVTCKEIKEFVKHKTVLCSHQILKINTKNVGKIVKYLEDLPFTFAFHPSLVPGT